MACFYTATLAWNPTAVDTLHGTPAQVAEILVENSSWLCERSGMPTQPVEGPLEINLDALLHLQGDDDTLEAYLHALYYDGGGY